MKITQQFSLLFYIFLTCHSHTLAQVIKSECNHNDKQALLKIKAHFRNTSAFSTWDQNTNCCKSWRFVLCTNDLTPSRVDFLFIDDVKDISGQIPAEVGDLPFLSVLRFSRSPKLTGPIPATITKLSKLTTLVIKQNKKFGDGSSIPTFLSKISSLAELDLSSNGFSGTIPPSLSLLTNLTRLTLSSNKLTGSIPESFASFNPPNGLTLKLMNNRLSGTIPRSLGRAKLAELDVTGNRFTGDVSFLFGKDKVLGDLSLRRNNFKFDFSKIGLPQGLRTLDISHNHIYGSFPSGFDQLPVFSAIDVSYNHLCGPIPSSLNKFNASHFKRNKCLCGAPLPPCK